MFIGYFKGVFFVVLIVLAIIVRGFVSWDLISLNYGV